MSAVVRRNIHYNNMYYTIKKLRIMIRLTGWKVMPKLIGCQLKYLSLNVHEHNEDARSFFRILKHDYIGLFSKDM